MANGCCAIYFAKEARNARRASFCSLSLLSFLLVLHGFGLVYAFL